MSDFLSQIADVSVTSTTRTPTRAGFGVAMIVAFAVPWSTGSRVRTFTSLASMVTAGFVAADAAYQMAQAYFGQNPAPTKLKIGRKASASAQVIRYTLETPAVGKVYGSTVGGTAWTRTAAGTDLATECTAVAAAINALSGVSATAILATGGGSTMGSQTLSGASLNGAVGTRAMNPPRAVSLVLSSHADWDATTATVTGTRHGTVQTDTLSIPNGGNTTLVTTKLFDSVTSITIPAQSGTGGTFTVGLAARFTASGVSGTHVDVTTTIAGDLVSHAAVATTTHLEDVTEDPGLSADLDAIAAADSDFYGLLLDSNSSAEISVAALWVESRRKFLCVQTADSAAAESDSTTDILYGLKAAGYTHTLAFYYAALGLSTSWLAAGLLGSYLPTDPGASIVAYRTIAGVTVLDLSDDAHAAVLAKNASTYESLNGIAVTYDGKVSVGEWADVIRGLDWWVSRMRERILVAQLAAVAAGSKIAYTADGIDTIGGLVRAQNSEGVRVGLFAADPAPTVTTPDIATITAEVRATRVLGDVTTTARLAGAILIAQVRGTASA